MNDYILPAKVNPIKRPPVRFYGGKWRIASWIIENFPPHVCYCEPFSGGASVFFRKQPSRFECLNDMNSEIINFFDVLRDRSEVLVAAIELTPFSREEHRRAHIPAPLNDPIERARRFYIRSRQSFGSGEGTYSTGWRYQADDKRGTSVITEWNTLDHLTAAVKRLKHVQLENDDAVKVINRFDKPTTLFYVDPPYPFSTRHDNEHHYSHEMTDENHIELSTVLNSVQGMVIVSSYRSEMYQDLYAGWKMLEKSTRTNGGNPATECLWINSAATQLDKLPIFGGTGV